MNLMPAWLPWMLVAGISLNLVAAFVGALHGWPSAYLNLIAMVACAVGLMVTML